jgi:hypothetical protein
LLGVSSATARPEGHLAELLLFAHTLSPAAHLPPWPALVAFLGIGATVLIRAAHRFALDPGYSKKKKAADVRAPLLCIMSLLHQKRKKKEKKVQIYGSIYGQMYGQICGSIYGQMYGQICGPHLDMPLYLSAHAARHAKTRRRRKERKRRASQIPAADCAATKTAKPSGAGTQRPWPTAGCEPLLLLTSA